MKKILIPIFAFATLSLVPAHADDDTPLAKEMEVVNDSYKAIRRADDAAKGVELAREAQAAVLKAITMAPEMVESGGYPGGKEKGMVAYRKQMAQLFIIFCDVEEAFLDKDLDKVQELVTPLKESKKKGHNDFMEDE